MLAACDGVSKFPHLGNGEISSKVDQFEYQKKVKVYNVCLRGHLVKWGLSDKTVPLQTFATFTSCLHQDPFLETSLTNLENLAT